MQSGIETVFVAGDGKSGELYTLLFRIRPNTVIPPHSHPDERSCFVLSGLWYFGYGKVSSESGLKALPPGSHYTEPAGAPRRARAAPCARRNAAIAAGGPQLSHMR